MFGEFGRPSVACRPCGGSVVPAVDRKGSYAGCQQRQRLLMANGISPPADLGVAGDMGGVDDVLDAAVAAWTARETFAAKRSPGRTTEALTDGMTVRSGSEGADRSDVGSLVREPVRHLLRERAGSLFLHDRCRHTQSSRAVDSPGRGLAGAGGNRSAPAGRSDGG